MLLAMIVLQFLSVTRVSVCRCSPDCAGIMVRNAVVLNSIDTEDIFEVRVHIFVLL